MQNEMLPSPPRFDRRLRQKVLQEAPAKIVVEPAPLLQVLGIVETGRGDIATLLDRLGDLFRVKEGMRRAKHVGPV